MHSSLYVKPISIYYMPTSKRSQSNYPQQHEQLTTTTPGEDQSDTWRGVKIGELERGQLERLREQLIEKHREATKAAKMAKATNQGSTPRPVYSNDAT